MSSESRRPPAAWRTVGEAEQQIADALEADHELHAGEEFAGFGRSDSVFRDGRGHAAVDFHVKGVEIALALAERIEHGRGASGDAFSSGGGGLFGDRARFYGTANKMTVSGFGSGVLTAAVLMGILLSLNGCERRLDSLCISARFPV